MHITITAVGTRGDIQPFVALGQGLRQEGHTVRIATHQIHAELVTGQGLEFAPTEGNPREMLESLAGQSWLKSGGNPLTFWKRFWKLAMEGAEKGLYDSMAACAGTDAIIYTFFGAAGYHMAEKMEIPRVMGLLQPFTRTRVFPYCLIPQLPLGGTYNRWSYLLTEQIAWLSGRRLTNRWRQEALGLDPLPIRSPFSQLYETGEPFIYGFSEHVIPRPGDWPAAHEITGYWFLDGEGSWSPPPDLLDFLSSGPKPVYIGFGSMAGRLAEKLTDIALEAVALAKQRAILLGGWAMDTERDLPDTVLAIPSAPHDWLFPLMAAVVHHGGADTTAAGLRAGTPSLVVPFFADQPFWGKRVHALGAGPRPLAGKKLTAQKLAGAITQAVSDPEMARRASLLGEKLRAEDGVGRAVERVLHYLSR